LPKACRAKIRPITNDELAQAGLKQSDFQDSIIQRSLEISKKYAQSDQLFGVPLDIHTIVLYYNKTALKKAGLLGSDSKPTGTDSLEAFAKMLGEAKSKTHLLPIAESTNSADPASCWRVWYTLFRQQNGDFIKDNQLSFADVKIKAQRRLKRWPTGPRKGTSRRTPLTHRPLPCSRLADRCS
jgi:multiple sugar transport system substrate-binding protein